MINDGRQMTPNSGAEYFIADLSIGMFTERQIDFYLDEEHPVVFARVYRNADDLSRALGIGTNDSLDIFLVGQMGSFIDLIKEDGGRVHFVHVDPKDSGGASQLYRATGDENLSMRCSREARGV
jgi:hypothetical protein